jgi:hypothetical protein
VLLRRQCYRSKCDGAAPSRTLTVFPTTANIKDSLTFPSHVVPVV